MPPADNLTFLLIVKKEHLFGALFLWEKWGSNGRFPPISYVIPVEGTLYLNTVMHVQLV